MGFLSGSGGWAALDDEMAGWLAGGHYDVEAGLAGQAGELGQGVCLAACYQHVDAQGAGRVVGGDAAEDDNGSRGAGGGPGAGGLRAGGGFGAGGFGAAGEGGYGRGVGAVVEGPFP